MALSFAKAYLKAKEESNEKKCNQSIEKISKNIVSKKEQPPLHAPKLNKTKLYFRSEPQLAWKPENFVRLRPLSDNPAMGVKTDLTNGSSANSRELIMGLDFGTSCTKVVIDDREMQQRYAVPLVNSPGVDGYLLPARLNEFDGVYTLEDKGVAFTDLKLSMMASSWDEVACSKVCVYLSFVIRMSRSWLFTHHRKAFLNHNILWTLALGQPTDQVTSNESKKYFESLARVAWVLASSLKPITPELALSTWKKRDFIENGDELEVIIVPELAAQIHGFVSSHGFDPRGKNTYLMIDVGAGTVDASIFHVKKDSSGTVSFHFFTKSVEPYGAANLHRFRVNWWQEQLEEHEEGRGLLELMDSIKMPTEYRGRYPVFYTGYVNGVTANIAHEEKTPDDNFFQMVRDQITSKVMVKAWKENKLSQEAIKDIPMFLCGGGARHALYKKLKESLRPQSGARWLCAEYRELTLPSDLIAQGVTRTDYDRLSVAYGLSRLIPGKIKDAEPMLPSISETQSIDWRSYYIDK